MCITCNALPFWGSGKFHTKPPQPEKPVLKQLYNQDQCNVLVGVLGSKLPIELRKTALNYIEQNCVGISNPPAPKVPKSRRRKFFTAYHL